MGDFDLRKLPLGRLQTLWEWKNRVLLEEYYIFNVAIPLATICCNLSLFSPCVVVWPKLSRSGSSSSSIRALQSDSKFVSQLEMGRPSDPSSSRKSKPSSISESKSLRSQASPKVRRDYPTLGVPISHALPMGRIEVHEDLLAQIVLVCTPST